MGAVDFTAYEIGPDAKTAFRSAREEAEWEDGHNGYTGTIAEKHDFQMVTVPKGVDPKKFLAALTAWASRQNVHPSEHTEWMVYHDADGKRHRTRYVLGKYRATKQVPFLGEGLPKTGSYHRRVDGKILVPSQSVKTLKGFVPPRDAFWNDKNNPAACVDFGPATKANLTKLGLLDEWTFKPRRGQRVFKFFGSARH